MPVTRLEAYHATSYALVQPSSRLRKRGVVADTARIYPPQRASDRSSRHTKGEIQCCK
jgi:hypothetical protein